MSELHESVPPVPPPAVGDDGARSLAVIVYVLYLISFAAGITAIAGVIIAYIKRDDVRGTIYESHFDNAIFAFWVFLVGMVVAVPLCFVLVGIPLAVGLCIWVMYRSIKGLLRVSEGKAYI
jgi:uncharacterized membrane protein